VPGCYGQPAAALEFQLKALKTHEASNVPRLLIQGLNAVAVTYQVLGDNDRARAYYERALAAAEKTGVASYVDFMTANLGAFLSESELDVDRGRDMLERAVAAGAGRFAAQRYSQLAEAYRRLGRYQDSLAAAERCRERARLLLIAPTPARKMGERSWPSAESRALADQGDPGHCREDARVVGAIRLPETELPAFWEDAYDRDRSPFSSAGYREALRGLGTGAFASVHRPAGVARAPGQATRPDITAAVPSTSSTLRSERGRRGATVDGLTAIAARLHSALIAYG
jgi:tetratricopeptide (TPR) repeat protein